MTVLFLHFAGEPRDAKAEKIARGGFHLIVEEPRWPTFYELAKREKPHAIIVDFSRAPSHAQETVDYLSKARDTRDADLYAIHVPEDRAEILKERVPKVQIVSEKDLPARLRAREEEIAAEEAQRRAEAAAAKAAARAQQKQEKAEARRRAPEAAMRSAARPSARPRPARSAQKPKKRAARKVSKTPARGARKAPKKKAARKKPAARRRAGKKR